MAFGNQKPKAECLRKSIGKAGKSQQDPVRKIRTKNTDCYRGKNKGGIKMPYNSQALGLVIATERIRNGMSQEQLSGLAGISRSHLAALESGNKIPRIDTLWRIAEALSIRPSKLLVSVEKNAETGDK